VAPFNDPSQIGGVGWILATQWMPYQLSSFVTPPFPGLASGHSTFSRSAAEVLTMPHRHAVLSGRIGRIRYPTGLRVAVEYGPTTDLALQWRPISTPPIRRPYRGFTAGFIRHSMIFPVARSATSSAAGLAIGHGILQWHRRARAFSLRAVAVSTRVCPAGFAEVTAIGGSRCPPPAES